MADILFTSQSYGFGTSGCMLTLVPYLKKNGHKLIFLGSGTAYQLAEKEPLFDELYEINTTASDFIEKATPIFQKIDVLISILERPSIQLAQNLHIPTIWIDVLFFYWDTVPDFLLDSILAVDVYIKQNSIKDTESLKKYKTKIKNLREVGPIIDTSMAKKTDKKNQAIITYGGLEAEGRLKVGVDTNYPYFMTKLLVEKVDFNNFDKVIFCGNKIIIKELKKTFENEKFHFSLYPHAEYLKELAESKVSLLVGGITSTLESFVFNTPAIFLPPSNPSQYIQLDGYRESGVAYLSVHLREYFKALTFPLSMQELHNQFFDQLKQLENNSLMQDNIAKKLSEFLSSDELLSKQLNAQNKFLDSLGRDGLQETISIIEEFINTKNPNMS